MFNNQKTILIKIRNIFIILGIYYEQHLREDKEIMGETDNERDEETSETQHEEL